MWFGVQIFVLLRSFSQGNQSEQHNQVLVDLDCSPQFRIFRFDMSEFWEDHYWLDDLCSKVILNKKTGEYEKWRETLVIDMPKCFDAPYDYNMKKLRGMDIEKV